MTVQTVHTLARIDAWPVPDDSEEIRIFMNERNEIRRLPGFFEHYRKLGATRFFVIDNGSTDGSKDFLLAQPDCHVFATSASYAESQYGTKWHNALIDQFGTDRWCLLVDADEWFVYPGYERKSLIELAGHLDQTGAQGMFSFLLDMYGPDDGEEAAANASRSLLEQCPYFDREYRWTRRFYIAGIEKPPFPTLNVHGGPRLRLLYPNSHRYYYLMRAVYRARKWLKFPLPSALRSPPALTKIPFVRWRPGTRFIDSHHTTPIRLSDVTGVLLHFKFLEDFYARLRTEAERKEHADGGAEYRHLLAKLKDRRALSLRYSGSVRYEGSEQLLQLGLLREDEAWRQLRLTAAGAGRHEPAPEPEQGRERQVETDDLGRS